jgi:hypothetical protein
MRLRVMAEYGSSGVWLIGQQGAWRHVMIEHSSLRMPAELAEGFRRWIDWYERWLEDAPFDTPPFNAEGRRLASALKRFVGPDVYVEFVPKTDRGGSGDAEVL